jgi:hypothetical protein
LDLLQISSFRKKGAKLPRLSALDLRQTALSRRAMQAFIESPLAEQLVRLDLRGTVHRPESDAPEVLARRGPWPHLALLDFRQNYMDRALRDRLRQRFGERVLL